MNDRTNPSSSKPGTAKRSAKRGQTNPKATARSSAAGRPAADDRTNPSSSKPGTAGRSTKRGQANPKATASSTAAGQSGADDRTNLSAAAKLATAKRSAKRGQANPKATARSTAAGRPAADGRTNPKPAEIAGGSPAPLRYDDAYIRGILKRVKTIAAVGMSANDMRPSYFAMLYLQQKGYRMIPVNPRYAGQQILGETVVASLDDLPAPPDMVQIFRKSKEAPAAVDEAIRAGAKVVWLQLGIRSDEAAAKAQAAGLDVVMDRCPKIEYGRLFGEIGWAGVNRRVISAKKGQAMQLSPKKGGLTRQPGARR